MLPLCQFYFRAVNDHYTTSKHGVANFLRISRCSSITGYGSTLYVGIALVLERCGAWSSFCMLRKHSK